MVNSKRPKRAMNLDPWPEDVTMHLVASVSSAIMSDSMLQYLAACQRRDPADMLVAVKSLRHVVTKLDQFRRSQAKKWAESAPPIPNSEEVKT